MHKLGHLIPQTKALIVDEVHEFTSKKSIELFEQMENAIYRLGFSATPFKHDDEGHNMACDISAVSVEWPV
jgi:superfamily II DNA or RNA helicase